jgi:hypothetical protein
MVSSDRHDPVGDAAAVTAPGVGGNELGAFVGPDQGSQLDPRGWRTASQRSSVRGGLPRAVAAEGDDVIGCTIWAAPRSGLG